MRLRQTNVPLQTPKELSLEMTPLEAARICYALQDSRENHTAEMISNYHEQVCNKAFGMVFHTTTERDLYT